MGCGMTKEKIEIEMLYLQLMRTEIQDERRAILEKFEELTGTKITRLSIPDYIDESDKEKETIKRNNHRTKKSSRINKRKRKIHTRKEQSEDILIYEIPSDDNN
jgi:hypothetical protein